jgi:hypothetical protein
MSLISFDEKMNRYYVICIFGLLLLISSCFKEDDKIEPHDSGDVKTVEIALTPTYEYQVYYDLDAGQQVSENIKTEWDLGFEANHNAYHIILNSAKFMLVANTGLTDFDALLDTAGMVFKYDQPDGNLDSTAIGDWIYVNYDDSTVLYTHHVYIINRGYDEVGNFQGFKKVIFQSLEEGIYTLRFADLDGSDEHVASVNINEGPIVSFMSFSFDSGGSQLQLEPGRKEWTLQFTQYTSIVYTNTGEPYSYLVTGALSNRHYVGVAEDTLMNFDEITLEIARELSFDNSLDVIGYDWKVAVGDPTSGSIIYVTKTDINYIIRDYNGFHYKLRFVSFYNSGGDKGYPTFEYQRL